MGWSGIKNGELLDKMRQERFDVFITGDRNLQFQQHLPTAGVAVVVLRARSTRLAGPPAHRRPQSATAATTKPQATRLPLQRISLMHRKPLRCVRKVTVMQTGSESRNLSAAAFA